METFCFFSFRSQHLYTYNTHTHTHANNLNKRKTKPKQTLSKTHNRSCLFAIVLTNNWWKYHTIFTIETNRKYKMHSTINIRQKCKWYWWWKLWMFLFINNEFPNKSGQTILLVNDCVLFFHTSQSLLEF